MEYIEFEKDLIAILLAVESVHDKNKLLFKYEKSNTRKQPDDPTSFHSSYSIVIAKDFDPASITDEDAPRTTFRNFDEITLSILTTPNAYGINVEVQVDDILFVGHTLGLENNENLKSFAIFFALRATTSATVVLSYQEMSKRIGTAIRCEEQRASYLNHEYAKLISVIQQYDIESMNPLVRKQHDEDKTRDRQEKERSKEELYATMIKQSVLASTLKQIYTDLQACGEINITINNWLTVSCCLPHRSMSMNCPLSMDHAFEVLTNAQTYLKPYHGLLLVIDPTILLASLPVDSSSTLNTLVRNLRSYYSLSRLSIEISVPLSQIYRLASHLIYWGRAKVIYPITDDNIYIISPDADISKQGALSKLYKETFPKTSNYRTLQEALAEYSDAVAFYDHTSRNEDIDMRESIQQVEWLLRYRLLVQVHYYYYLVLPNDDRSDFRDEYKKTRLPKSRINYSRVVSESIKSSSPLNITMSCMSIHNSNSADTSKKSHATSQDDPSHPLSSINSTATHITHIPLNYLSQVEQALPNERHEYRERLALEINNIKESHVTDFLKIVKYLNGKYHLEEITSLENMSRLQISMIVEKFKSIVVRALHPDPNPILQI